MSASIGLQPETVAGLHQALEWAEAWSRRCEVLSRRDALSLFLAHISEKVPHYRSYFATSKGHRNRLKDFPVISRTDLSLRFREFLAESQGEEAHLFAKTSGSTGKPLTVLFDQASWYDLNYETYSAAAQAIPNLASHLMPGRPGVVLLTAEVNRHPASLVLLSLQCSLFERRILGIDKTQDLRLVEELRARHVPLLYGKPTYLLRLAELDSAVRPKTRSIRPVALLTSGENLFADIRESLEKWFKCRVSDAYISVEGGLVAMQCPSTRSYHVQNRRVRLEVLKHDGTIGEDGAGELLLTNLSNWALPLVRYRTGDQGTLQKRCVCGYSGQTLVELPAREASMFRVRGKEVATEDLDAILLSKQVKQFQLTQTAETEFALTWIPSSANRDEDRSNHRTNERLARSVQQVLGEVGLQSRAVKTITKPGGKIRRYVKRASDMSSASSAAHREPAASVLSNETMQAVRYAAFNASSRVVIAMTGNNLLIANVGSVAPALCTLKIFQDELRCGALSADGMTFAAADENGNVHICDLGSGEDVGKFQGHRGPIDGVAFAAAGKRLVTAGDDGDLKTWDVGSWALLGSASANRRPIVALAVSFDGSVLADADSEGRIRVWDDLTLKHFRSFGGEHPIASLSFTPDCDALAAGCADHAVRLWDSCSGRLLAVLKGHSGPVVAVSFCPDAKTVVSGSLDGTVRVWHAWSGRHLSTLTGHAGAVRSLFVSKDNRTVVSGGEDGTVRLWPIIPATEH